MTHIFNPLAQLAVLLGLPLLFWGCASIPCQDATERYLGLETIGAVLELDVLGSADPPSKHKIPGAQVVIGNREKVLYAIERGRLSADASSELENLVTPDTLFDLASLTKPLVTAPGIMLLQERGMLNIADPLAKFLPEFGNTAIGDLTLEELLRHRSGLPDTLEIAEEEGRAALERAQHGEDVKSAYLRQIPGLMPTAPRKDFVYSDLGYILLAVVIERVSGLPLNEFAQREIFMPLGMTRSGFRPAPGSVCARAWRWCEVNDNTAYYYLGGVAGSAGAYATALDVARFAQMILNNGMIQDGSGHTVRFLQAASVAAMTSDPSHDDNRRGLGWDIDTRYSCAPRGTLPKGSFGHTGFTGTSLWIDQDTGLFVVILTNEVDAKKGLINPLRWKIAERAAVGMFE